jgi:hypothetical protein
MIHEAKNKTLITDAIEPSGRSRPTEAIDYDELNNRKVIFIPVLDIDNREELNRTISTIVNIRKYYDEKKVEYTYSCENIASRGRMYIIEKK